MEKSNFKVVFEIEVVAESPLSAVKIVDEWIKDPDAGFTFIVQNAKTGEIVSVNLESPEKDAVLPHEYTPLIDNSLTNEANRQRMIGEIRRIIREWGPISSGELELESSPCVYSFNGIIQLIKAFNRDTITVVTYQKDNEVDQSYMGYDDLSDEILTEVLGILDQYDAERIYWRKYLR